MGNFYNVSYLIFEFMQSDFILNLWKKYLCPIGFHAFDEVQSSENHYLFCDGCNLSIAIDEEKSEYLTKANRK